MLFHFHQEFSVELVVLAGYLKLIPSSLVRAFKRRILNIHPALLPAFGGKGYYGGKVRTERDLFAVSDKLLCLCMPLHA
jgi:phosphoribosylglycinamide formyltransferase